MTGLIVGLILYYAETGVLAQFAGDAPLAWAVGLTVMALTPPWAYVNSKESE